MCYHYKGGKTLVKISASNSYVHQSVYLFWIKKKNDTMTLHKYKLVLLVLMSLFSVGTLSAMEAYPSNWFVQMKWNKVQVLLRDKAVDFTNATISTAYKGVAILKVHHFQNTHYVALDIALAPNVQPGNLEFVIKNGKKIQTHTWPIKERRAGRGTLFAQGLSQADFIYFLMPDRFSNGDITNDRIPNLKDQSLNRDSIFLRHGGDLKGVINHLDYIQNLGATALWTTPVIENDMPDRTEHGYAATNHYAIEKRFGGETAYLALSDSLHKRGMKLVYDIVYNHVGRFHSLVQDAPSPDWLHQWPTYTQTHYKDQVAFDPYFAKKDRKKLVDGWFTTEMPDLNHDNVFVANFLIQHAIWVVETFGVDAFRIDTYIYNDLVFMNRCNKALLTEYPSLFSFGEAWVHGTPNQAYFAENNMNTKFKSNLQAVADFQLLTYGIQPALNEKFGWTEGVNKLYNTLSQDFLYKDPSRNVIFLDNHDMTRILSQVGENIAKVKMGIGWLMTCRGIPQLYYGTEVLMKGISNPDGWVRLDFPGGWEGDTKNAFTGAGLSAAELDMQAYVRKLAQFRKTSSAISKGALMQYLPNEGLYVYFRYNEEQTIMCIMNTSETERKISFSDFSERTNGFTGGKEVVSGFQIKNLINIPAQTMQVFELNK